MTLRQAACIALTIRSLFDGVVGAFNELAALVLRTLHLELRCHIIHTLTKSFKGTYVYADADEAPEESVLNLVTSLLDYNQEITNYLQPREIA